MTQYSVAKVYSFVTISLTTTCNVFKVDPGLIRALSFFFCLFDNSFLETHL
jgi:hypothetical protein